MLHHKSSRLRGQHDSKYNFKRNLCSDTNDHLKPLESLINRNASKNIEQFVHRKKSQPQFNEKPRETNNSKLLTKIESKLDDYTIKHSYENFIINEVYKDLKHQVESLELYLQLQKGKVYPKDAQVENISLSNILKKGVSAVSKGATLVGKGLDKVKQGAQAATKSNLAELAGPASGAIKFIPAISDKFNNYLDKWKSGKALEQLKNCADGKLIRGWKGLRKKIERDTKGIANLARLATGHDVVDDETPEDESENQSYLECINNIAQGAIDTKDNAEDIISPIGSLSWRHTLRSLHKDIKDYIQEEKNKVSEVAQQELYEELRQEHPELFHEDSETEDDVEYSDEGETLEEESIERTRAKKEEMHLKDLVFNSKLGLNVVAPFFSGGFAGPIADDLVTGGFNSAKEKIERNAIEKEKERLRKEILGNVVEEYETDEHSDESETSVEDSDEENDHGVFANKKSVESFSKHKAFDYDEIDFFSDSSDDFKPNRVYKRKS